MLGASPLSSFSEGTDAAQVCDRVYDDLRDSVILTYPWSFSLKKIALARSVDTPVSEWTYQYPLPADLLGSGPRALFTDSSAGSRPINSGWEIYERNILTDYETVLIDYQFRPSEDVMPTYFVQLLKYFTCWHIAEPVTDQTTKSQYWQAISTGMPSENGRGGALRQCMNIDGASRPSEVIEDFSLIAIRG